MIIDEAHERTGPTDVLLGLLRRAVTHRKNLKVIIISAIRETARFATYFNTTAVFNVEGKTYPVDIMYLQKQASHFMYEALKAAYTICKETRNGDILVFLPTIDTIEKGCAILRGIIPREVSVFPLYSGLETDRKHMALNVNHCRRKCILATNVAETSVTIDGVRFVVGT